jgi:glyceraldehyde 3-phosphate dehydrogenase
MGRAGANNIVPTSTGAAIATTKVLPEFEGNLMELPCVFLFL